MKLLAMFWKGLILLGLAVAIKGDDTSHAISEQKVTIRHTQNGDSKAGKNNEHHEEYAKSYPSYEFLYKVSDPDTKDIKGQHETRDGDKVNGLYWLLQPNGFQRTVKYAADDNQGFKANVRYHSQKGNKYGQDENNNQNSNANSNEKNNKESSQKTKEEDLMKAEVIDKPKQNINYWSNRHLRNRNKTKPNKRPDSINFSNILQKEGKENRGLEETTNSEEGISNDSSKDIGRDLKDFNDKALDLPNENNNNNPDNKNVNSRENEELNENSNENEKDGDNETISENNTLKPIKSGKNVLKNGQNARKIDAEDEKQTRNNAQEGSSNINKRKRLGNRQNKKVTVINDNISNENVRGENVKNINEEDAPQEPDQEDNNDRFRNNDNIPSRHRKIKNRRKNKPSTYSLQGENNKDENKHSRKQINKLEPLYPNKKINNNDDEPGSNQNSEEELKNIRNIESNTRDKSRSLDNVKKSEKHENKFLINAQRVYKSNIQNINREKDKFNARVRFTENNHSKNNGHFRNIENLSEEVFEHHIVVYHPTKDETK